MIDAGELRERIEILEYQQKDGAYTWQPIRKSWAKAVLTTKKNIFSTRAVGASGVTFTIRRQDITLGHAVRWGGQHCFITSIIPLDRLHLVVEAALVDLTDCEYKEDGIRFQAVVQEKYVKFDELNPMDINELRHVLIVPKAIRLDPGKLVEVNGIPCPVRIPHELDSWKNEYEIERTVEL